MNIRSIFSQTYPSNFCRAVVVLVCLVFFTGCDASREVRTGEIPPEISGTDIHSEYISLRQLKGKVVILYFWTNSCCGEKLKLLEPYYLRNKDKGLEILAINVENSS